MRMLCDGFLVEFELDGLARHRDVEVAPSGSAGDRLTGSRSCWTPGGRRPAEMGIVRFRHEVVNQAGETVVWMENPIFFRRGAMT